MAKERIIREQTRNFPIHNSRSDWVQKERKAPEWNNEEKCWEFEYEVFEEFSELSRAGGLPFLICSHKSQLREDHQRVVRGPNGGMMHVSGAEVMPSEIEAFMLTPAAFRWIGKRGQRWLDDRDRTLAPFVFPAAPWAGGQDEELDPQWQRETFTLPISKQVEKLKEKRLDRAERRRESGDKRGTSLHLEISASGNDADQTTLDSTSIVAVVANSDSTGEHMGFRWLNVTIPPGATIDNAILSVFLDASSNDMPLHRLRGHDVDNSGIFVAGSGNNNIDGRARTTATINWDSTDLGVGAGGSFVEWGAATAAGAGVTIEAIIQEIVDRAGWVSGNALSLILEQHTDNSARDLRIVMWDGSSAESAELDIDYTEPALVPVVTDVTPTTVQDTTEIVVTGTDFISPQGTGKVEIGDNATYASANLEELTVSAWGDTEITADIVQGALAAGSVWVFVTNDDGEVSNGFEITLAEITISDVDPDSITDEDTGITITGTAFESVQGTGKVELGDNSTYGSANLEEQNVESWTDTSIDFTASLGSLTPGTLFVFITNNTGNVSNGFQVTVNSSVPPQAPIPSSPISSGVGIRLENIYAALSGHDAPKTSRSEYWLLGKIGQLQGLNLTSGNKSLESHLIALYENLSGGTYNGARSAELILRAIEDTL